MWNLQEKFLQNDFLTHDKSETANFKFVKSNITKNYQQNVSSCS